MELGLALRLTPRADFALAEASNYAGVLSSNPVSGPGWIWTSIFRVATERSFQLSYGATKNHFFFSPI